MRKRSELTGLFRCQIAFLAISLMLGARSAAANDRSSWRVISIPGATDIEAQGTNNAGQVVGFYGVAADDRLRGFLRDKNGSITTIDLFSDISTVIYGINNAGQAVGVSGTSYFIRQPDGSITTIPYSALAINDRGQLAGSAASGAFITDTSGNLILFSVPGSVGAIAWGLNNLGEAVGWSVPRTGGQQLDGFLRTADGTLTTIDVPDALMTVATGINDSGQIIGYYGTFPNSYPGSVQYHGFIRDTDGTLTTFDAPSLGSTKPNGISSSTGFIVGNFSHNRQNGSANLGFVRSCILCP